VDIRSCNTVGGFLGTGNGGYSEVNGRILFDVPGIPTWQRDIFYETSSALTTVRWPVNFKNLPDPLPGDQWNFWPKALPPQQQGDWKHCKDGDRSVGSYSGLFSREFASKRGKKGKQPTFNVGGNTPIQSVHPGGAMVLFVDGHVSLLTDGTAGTDLAGRGSVLERLCIRDDGTPVAAP